MRTLAWCRALAGPRLHGGRALRLLRGLRPRVEPTAAHRDAVEQHMACGHLGRFADNAVEVQRSNVVNAWRMRKP